MLNGTRAAKVFSELENPIIVVRKEELKNTEQKESENTTNNKRSQKSEKTSDTNLLSKRNESSKAQRITETSKLFGIYKKSHRNKGEQS